MSVEVAPPRGELLIAHDPNAGEVTEVRTLVVQSSLAELKAHGYYERYAKCIAPATREDLESRVAPGWIPVAMVVEHYQACENMSLSNEELSAMGQSVGERLQSATLVTPAKKSREEDFDLWQIEAQIHRMWQRLYRGGSVQVTKLGPKEKHLEQRGYPMNHFRYYRQGALTALAAVHSAVGVQITQARIEKYEPATRTLSIRLRWA